MSVRCPLLFGAVVLCALLLLAACGGAGSSSNTAQPVTGGMLALTIIGLPNGVGGNVSVTGPGGYSQTVSSSQSLSQLAPGAYTVQGNSVNSASSNYYPASFSQTVAVANGTTTSVQVNYNVVAPTTTKALDQTGSQSLTVTPDGITFTMPSSSTVAQSLSVGDTLAVGVTTATPQGALRKILSVGQNGSQIVATTSQATLVDAFQQVSFTFQGALSPPSSNGVKILRRGVRLIKKDEYQRLKRRFHAMDTLSDPCAGNSATYLQMVDVQLADDSAGTLTGSGQVEVCPSFQFNWSIGGFPPTLQNLTAAATFNADVHVNVTGRYDNSFDQNVPLLTITSDPITVFAGPIPIVLTPEVTFFVGASGEVNAGFSTGATQTVAATAGISYANGQTSPVFTSTSNFATDPLALDAGLSSKVYAGVTLALNVEGVLSPEFSPDAYINLDVDLLANPWWDLTAGLEGSGSVGISIFDIQLKDFDYPNLFNFSQPLAQASGGFLTAAAAPVLQITNPNTVAAGSQSFTLTIAGSNFVPGAFVSFNGQPLSTTYLSPLSLTAIVPTNDLAVGGSFPVTATNPDTPGATSNPITFNVVGGSGISVSVIPSTAQVPATEAQQFMATVTGTSNIAVNWAVNGISGGNAVIGTITSTGLYTSPASVPTPPTVTVTATSQASAGASGSAKVTIGPFKVNNLYSFTSLSDGAAPSAPLIQASDGYFYGTTQLGGTNGDGTVFKVDASGNVTPLFEFSGPDGSEPLGALVQASDGNFYGTTNYGGADGDGTIFQIDSSGNLTPLYSFTGGADGAQPLSGLIEGTDGQLYGTTFSGGNFNSGTVFRTDLSGNLTTLYSFSGGSDGYGPEAPLIQAADSYFYGTTQNGGNNSCNIAFGTGCGTVFKIDPTGNLTTLYSFSGGGDGANPDETLVQGSDGNFYGTTLFGGDSSCAVSTHTGCGTIFRIDSAQNFTMLHSFSGGNDGGVPFSSLIQASDGNFYGTATAGGDPSCSVTASGENFPSYIGCGSVFKMDSSGNVDALYSFTGSPNDGSNPFAAVLEGSDGYFYGTTRWGGSGTASCSYTNNGGCGTFFRVSGPGGPLPQQRSLRKIAIAHLSPKLAPVSSEKYLDQQNHAVHSSAGYAKPLPLKGSKRKF